jgi:hypothetical protein
MIRATIIGVAIGVTVAAVSACASGPYGKVTEIVSSSVPGDSFKTIVVISGDDDQNSLQVTARVRQQLNDRGLNAQKRSGLWTTEREALGDICPLGEVSAVDGLLFVMWNELDLYDCRTHKPAYQVRGGMIGTNVMVQRMMRYLRPGS